MKYDLYNASRDGNGVLSFRDVKSLIDEQVKILSARQKWIEVADAHRKKGGEVLSEEEMSKAITSYGHPQGSYVQADQFTYDYGKNGGKYSALMGKHAPPIILAHDRDYRALTLYRKKDAIAAIEKAGHKKRPKPRGYDNSSYQKEEQKRNELAARMQVVVAAAGKLMLAAAKKPAAKPPWELITAALLERFNDEPLKVLCQNHGWKVPGGYRAAHKVIVAQVGRMPANQIPALLAEIVILATGDWDRYGMRWDANGLALAKFYRIDLAKLTKELAPPPVKEKKKVQTPGKSKFKSGARLTSAKRKQLSEAMKARWAARRKTAAAKGGKK